MKRFHLAVAVVVLVGVNSTAFGQSDANPDFRTAFGDAQMLLEMPDVRYALNLTDEQKQKLQAALRADLASLQNLSWEERQKRIQEMAKKTDETIKSVLDEKQQKRYEELRIQIAGALALGRAEVADKLGLEQAQKDKIKEIQIQEQKQNAPNILARQNGTPEESRKGRAEMLERRRKTKTELLAVLTPAQKEAFGKMQGEKLLSKTTFRYFVGSPPSTRLLEMPSVQDELNLTVEQKQKLQQQKLARNGFRRSEYMSMSEVKSLLDEKQQKRLEELRIQREGSTALASAQVAAKLELDWVQIDKIIEIDDQARSNRRANYRNLRNATLEEYRKYYAESRKREEKVNAEFLGVLTPAQKEAFEKLQGEKFDFSRRSDAQNP